MNKKIYQLLEDGHVYVDVLEATEICNDLNDMGVIHWVFPCDSSEVRIELNIKEEN